MEGGNLLMNALIVFFLLPKFVLSLELAKIGLIGAIFKFARI